MNFSELVKIRQSVRNYDERSVETEKIEQCIATTRLSPSANNSQPWKFIFVESPDILRKVAECATGGGMNKFALKAPVIVAVVRERPGLMSRIGGAMKNKDYSLMDIGIAVNQFCLQAAELGLGSCIIGWFDEKGVKKVLHVPPGLRVPLLITLGYTQSQVKVKTRRAANEMSSHNHY